MPSPTRGRGQQQQQKARPNVLLTAGTATAVGSACATPNSSAPCRAVPRRSVGGWDRSIGRHASSLVDRYRTPRSVISSRTRTRTRRASFLSRKAFFIFFSQPALPSPPLATAGRRRDRGRALRRRRRRQSAVVRSLAAPFHVVAGALVGRCVSSWVGRVVPTLRRRWGWGPWWAIGWERKRLWARPSSTGPERSPCRRRTCTRCGVGREGRRHGQRAGA